MQATGAAALEPTSGPEALRCTHACSSSRKVHQSRSLLECIPAPQRDGQPSAQPVAPPARVHKQLWPGPCSRPTGLSLRRQTESSPQDLAEAQVSAPRCHAHQQYASWARSVGTWPGPSVLVPLCPSVLWANSTPPSSP